MQGLAQVAFVGTAVPAFELHLVLALLQAILYAIEGKAQQLFVVSAHVLQSRPVLAACQMARLAAHVVGAQVRAVPDHPATIPCFTSTSDYVVETANVNPY